MVLTIIIKVHNHVSLKSNCSKFILKVCQSYTSTLTINNMILNVIYLCIYIIFYCSMNDVICTNIISIGHVFFSSKYIVAYYIFGLKLTILYVYLISILQ